MSNPTKLEVVEFSAADTGADPPEPPPTGRDKFRTGHAVGAGLIVIFTFVGGFATWASMAPIGGAVVGGGALVARGQNKLVQHLEGGIIKVIHVREGDRVRKNDVLIELDATPAAATMARAAAELDMYLAREARLVAERNGAESIAFPNLLLDRKDNPEVARIIDDQENEFRAKRERFRSETDILAQKIKALEEEIQGMETQRRSIERQLTLIREEITANDYLFKKQLTLLSRVLAIKRREAELEGNDGEYVARIGKSRQEILQNRHEIERNRTVQTVNAVKELAETRAKMIELRSQLQMAADIFSRVVIRAPTDGIVVHMNVNTTGGVVTRGQQMIEILPLPIDVMAEVRIRPEEIDQVRVGQKAHVRLAGLDINYSTPFDAAVEYISADKLVDEKDKSKTYFVARIASIELPPDLDRRKLYPGMPVTAFIATEQRTFFEYLLRPFRESMDRSLRER